MPRHNRRITLYAAFSATGAPVLNVYDFDKRRLSVLIADRIANGEAVAGEHLVRVTVDLYNCLLEKRGWPLVRCSV